MPARKLYFEAIRVGEELPALAKTPIDRVQLARYAGASGDYNPVHVDEVYARSAGMPSVYAPGMLIMGFLGQLVTDWARGGQLRRYHVRFVKIVWPADTVVCKGRVTDRWGTQGRYFVELELWAENQKGELVMKGNAQIQLFYSLEDENRQRSGQAPVVIEVARESILAAPTGEAASSPSPDSPGRSGMASAGGGAQTTAPQKKTAQRDKPAAKSAAAKAPSQKPKK